jgi:hypothetical protein
MMMVGKQKNQREEEEEEEEEAIDGREDRKKKMEKKSQSKTGRRTALPKSLLSIGSDSLKAKVENSRLWNCHFG